MTKDPIDAFIDALVSVPSGKDFTNIYREYESCRNNLALYLRFLRMSGVKAVIVGEAPGYKGCARTGIPFTDEAHLYLLKKKIPGLKMINEDERRLPLKELSAGTIWGVLHAHKDTLVLMWNIYPYHPHKGRINSNRTPRKEETEKGLAFLYQLIKIFPGVPVYAIGRTAQKRLGVSDDFYIRHPSHGGARICVKDLETKVYGANQVRTNSR